MERVRPTNDSKVKELERMEEFICDCQKCQTALGQTNSTHKVCENREQAIIKDLKKQAKLKKQLQQYSDISLAQKYSVHKSTIGYLRRVKQ